jgi:hypothetical protein
MHQRQAPIPREIVPGLVRGWSERLFNLLWLAIRAGGPRYCLRLFIEKLRAGRTSRQRPGAVSE